MSAITKEKLIKKLHILFGGKDGHSNKVEEFLEKPHDLDEAWRKAYGYYEFGKKGQENCRSDWTYWMYGGDIALAKVLVSIIVHMKRGNNIFPNFPNVDDKVLMDKQAIVEEWAQNLLTDHEHAWKTISLEHGEKNEDYPEGCPWATTVYDKCSICGVKRYSWEPPKPPSFSVNDN